MRSIYSEIIETYRTGLITPKPGWPPQIFCAVQTIHQNLFQHPIGVEEIKRTCNIRSKGFSGIFKYYVGRTPKSYILYHQCEVAKLLLREEDLLEMNCLEVGLTVGFRSPSSFTMAFKSRTGLSPSEWRKNVLLKTKS